MHLTDLDPAVRSALRESGVIRSDGPWTVSAAYPYYVKRRPFVPPLDSEQTPPDDGWPEWEYVVADTDGPVVRDDGTVVAFPDPLAALDDALQRASTWPTEHPSHQQHLDGIAAGIADVQQRWAEKPWPHRHDPNAPPNVDDSSPPLYSDWTVEQLDLELERLQTLAAFLHDLRSEKAAADAEGTAL